MQMNDSGMLTQSLPDRDAELEMLRECVEAALDTAQRGGAEGAEVNASSQAGLSVAVRLGEIETLEHHRDRGIAISVYLGKRKGSASSADLRPDAIRDCVQNALDIARYTEEDACNGLPDRDRLATEFPDLDLWHPRNLDVGAAIARALECEEAGRADPRISNSEGASVNIHAGLSVQGNSAGFVGFNSGTRYDQSCVLVAGDGENMQRDYWYDSRRCFDDLEAAQVTGAEAARRTVSRLGASQRPTAQVPVMFSPMVARGLIAHLVSAVSGSALYRNASFLKDALGEALFPDWLSVTENPMLPRAPGSCAFDGEGVATRQRKLVNGGTLEGYVLSSYSARRLGLETTGNAGGVHNLTLEGVMTPHDELLGMMDTGLLVTELMGQGVNIVTGDYSRGASGFWVEGGEIIHPVEEMTIAGNLRNMFAAIRAVGDDIDDRANIQAGSILIDHMTVAGS